MEPVLVISAHGIRTKGEWQEVLEAELSKCKIPFRSHKFGVYRLHRFILKSSNDAMVERFYTAYQHFLAASGSQIDLSDHQKRPSIVVHSFGTYLVGYAMLKYENVRFDKIILCGSILPRDFNWWTLFVRDQVHLVRNEYGVEDIWTKTVGWFVPKTGDGGSVGFNIRSRSMFQQRFDYFRHGDFFSPHHIETHWIPFLRKEVTGFSIRHGKDLTKEELLHLMQQTGNIDTQRFRNLAGYEESEVSMELGKQWIEINADIYTFLIDQKTGRPVGYVNAMPVTNEAFEKIRNGKLKDNEVTADDLVTFSPSNNVKLYCMSIAISEDLNISGLINEPLEKLLDGFCSKYIDYALTKDIFVTEMVAVGWTPQGRKLCSILGMSVTQINDKDGHPVYYCNVSAATQRSPYTCVENLIGVYQRYCKVK